jgi:uncharacterized membrane protein
LYLNKKEGINGCKVEIGTNYIIRKAYDKAASKIERSRFIFVKTPNIYSRLFFGNNRKYIQMLKVFVLANIHNYRDTGRTEFSENEISIVKYLVGDN